jgi:hypothetical protein
MQYFKLSSGAAMDDFLSAARRNSSQTVELTLAAAEVVFRRMTLGASFGFINMSEVALEQEVTQFIAGVSWAARLATLPRAICLLALEAQAAALAPIHRAATDNVERLRKVDGRP